MSTRQVAKNNKENVMVTPSILRGEVGPNPEEPYGFAVAVASEKNFLIEVGDRVVRLDELDERELNNRYHAIYPLTRWRIYNVSDVDNESRRAKLLYNKKEVWAPFNDLAFYGTLNAIVWKCHEADMITEETEG